MKTTSSARTVSRIRFATVVLPEPVPPQMPMIMMFDCGCTSRHNAGGAKQESLRRWQSHTVRSNQFRNDAPQQFGKLIAHAFAGCDDLVVIDGPIRNAGREIRDAGNAD